MLICFRDSLRPRCINKSHSTLQSGTTESSHDSRRSLKAFSSGSPETSSENEMSSPVFINKGKYIHTSY